MLNSHAPHAARWLQRSLVIFSCIEIIVRSAECFPALHFVKICLPTSKSYQNGKVKVNVLHWSGKVKIWGLLEGSLSLAEVGQHSGKNECSIHSAPLNSTHPGCGCFLGTTDPQIPRVCCNHIEALGRDIQIPSWPGNWWSESHANKFHNQDNLSNFLIPDQSSSTKTLPVMQETEQRDYNLSVEANFGQQGPRDETISPRCDTNKFDF
jgi:hypothetical protein